MKFWNSSKMVILTHLNFVNTEQEILKEVLEIVGYSASVGEALFFGNIPAERGHLQSDFVILE